MHERLIGTGYFSIVKKILQHNVSSDDRAKPQLLHYALNYVFLQICTENLFCVHRDHVTKEVYRS